MMIETLECDLIEKAEFFKDCGDYDLSNLLFKAAETIRLMRECISDDAAKKFKMQFDEAFGREIHE